MACKPSSTGDAVKKETKPEGVDVVLSPKAIEAARLKTGKPTKEPRRSIVAAAGTLDFAPSHVARVGPPAMGRVGAISVSPGQKVEKGALLISIDSADVGRARADSEMARSRMDRAKSELDREESLFKDHATSERNVLQAKTDYANAQSELRATQSRVSTLGVGGSGQSIPLTSPIAGTVLEVKARMGQPVGTTDTLVIVGETDPVWLAVDIYERDLSRVHTGDDVKVVSIAFPSRTFVGKVDNVATAVDPERHVAEARIVLANPDSALRPGMTASARIMGVPLEGGGMAITVPKDAVQTVDGQPFVFIEKEPGKYEMRGVERGADLDGSIEISRGLTGDETIVIDGTFILKSEVLKSQMGTND